MCTAHSDPYFHVSIFPIHRSVLRFAFEVRAYQYKVLPFGLSLSPRVFRKVAEADLERTGHAHSQLPRRLAHTGSVSGSVMRTHGFGAFATQPVGPSGQLKKEQTLTNAEDLFSRYGVGLIQSDSGPHAGTCSVGVELLEYGQEQDGGITEKISEAPGAYGSSRGASRARTGPHGQHCDRCVHQPKRWSTLPLHVATPLESESFEVASHHSHSGLTQPCSQQTVTSRDGYRNPVFNRSRG